MFLGDLLAIEAEGPKGKQPTLDLVIVVFLDRVLSGFSGFYRVLYLSLLVLVISVYHLGVSGWAMVVILV